MMRLLNIGYTYGVDLHTVIGIPSLMIFLLQITPPSLTAGCPSDAG